jgi:hypothetical protein
MKQSKRLGRPPINTNQDLPTIASRIENEVAKRASVGYRYDILDVDFLELMAKIASYGAKKYGDLNWHKSRLEGEKGPMNHIMDHAIKYIQGVPYDHPEVGSDVKIQLAAIAFNAMMEFYYCKGGTE